MRELQVQRDRSGGETFSIGHVMGTRLGGQSQEEGGITGVSHPANTSNGYEGKPKDESQPAAGDGDSTTVLCVGSTDPLLPKAEGFLAWVYR